MIALFKLSLTFDESIHLVLMLARTILSRYCLDIDFNSNYSNI